MFKNKIIITIIMYIYSTQILIADDFDEFLNKALKQSPYLKSAYLEKEQLLYKAAITTRYDNPELDINYGKYNSKNGISDKGYGISVSQPIRFWSINEDKKELSKRILNGAENFYKLDKANFIKEISLLYTKYEFNKELEKLTEESSLLSKEIYDISKERYSYGSISQADLLQAEAAFIQIQVQNESVKMETLSNYYNLLKFAGLESEVKLEFNHKFQIKDKRQISNNLELSVMENNQEINLAKLNIESNTFDSFNLILSTDKEPDQTVNKVGVSIPFPILNTRSEEKQIAMLESKKNDLLIQNRKNQLNKELAQLYKQRNSLNNKLKNTEKVLVLRTKLVEMYLEKFKISQASILEVQTVKDNVIQTQKELIQTNMALNQNSININYIQGDINEKTIID